jgi:hypothetical protein
MTLRDEEAPTGCEPQVLDDLRATIRRMACVKGSKEARISGQAVRWRTAKTRNFESFLGIAAGSPVVVSWLSDYVCP